MIDNPELLMHLQSEQQRAVDDKLNDERATALSFYRGELFGDEVDGRSKLRTRDVAEVVDYTTISVMRTMASGDRIVEFEPLEPGQDELAQEATDRVHWNFMREQDGYQILHDGIKAGILEKSGIWKTWVEIPQEPVQVRMNAADMDNLPGQVVDAIEVEGLFDLDELTGEPLAVYDVTIMQDGQPIFRDAAIANEEFFIAPDARSIDKAAYVGNTSRVSLADLEAMGYSWDVLETVWGDDDGDTQTLRDARDSSRGNRETDAVRRDYGRVVTLREEYTRWFVEGRYQLVMVHRVGNTILGVKPAHMVPYVLWSPFPMQHRLIGDSLADKTLDIQVVRSHMLRQAMDNLYQSNMPRTYVDENALGVNTIDDLLDVAPGGIIRGKGPQGVVPWTVPFVAGHAFDAMQIMAGEKESRTGITRLNQGLEADALNKTATGTALMQASGQQIEEYVARQAANAIGELFEKKLRLMIEFMQPHQFRIDGQFREIRPQDWPQNMRLGVRVGLGTGNRDKRLQGIAMLKQTMMEVAEVDPRLIDGEKAFNVAKLTVANLGLGSATQFFNDPSQLGPAPDQPDPEMAEIEAKREKSEAENQFRRDEAATRLRLMEEEQVFQQGLARDKAVFEAQLARDRMEAEIALLARQQQAQEENNIRKMRAGGDLDK